MGDTQEQEILSADNPFPSIAEQPCPKRRSDLNVRVVEGETVVLDRQGRLIHQLNQTASFIWDRCNGESMVAEITNQLGEAFDVDPKTAAKDAAATIGQLRKLNLLESC